MEIFCPKCGQHLKAADEAVGKRLKCAKCGFSFTAELGSDDAFQYATELVETKPTRRSKAAYFVIGALVLLVVIIIVNQSSGPKANSRPLHVLKEDLVLAKKWVRGLEYKKYEATHPDATAPEKGADQKRLAWSFEDERDLTEWRAKEKAIQDELTDRGQ